MVDIIQFNLYVEIIQSWDSWYQPWNNLEVDINYDQSIFVAARCLYRNGNLTLLDAALF